MITSDQIHEKEFSFKMRGYNDAEVDAYLDQLAAFIDNLSKENKDLRERLKSTTDQLTYMKNLETTLRDTLITAQRSAEETTRNANIRAEEIVLSANAEAEKIVKLANAEAEKIRGQLGALRQQAAVYRQNFRMLLGAQMQLLDDSGLGKEKAEESVAAPRTAASMPRINLVENRGEAAEKKNLQDQPLSAPKRIVPIPQEDE
jgi:cell division initiation protein